MLSENYFLIIYAGLGLVFSLFTHLRDRSSHIDEWKHSSIDFEEIPEATPSWFKKCLNKILSVTIHTCIFTVFWPVFLTASIISRIRSFNL